MERPPTSDFEIAETMQRCGGSFFRALGLAIHHADPVNLKKLKTVFADEWTEYQALTEKRLAREYAREEAKCRS
jgi:hypothetical protein